MKKVIFVLLDGLNYKNKDFMGYMRALENSGIAKSAKVMSELPTLSKPLYETLFTGKKPIEHGVLCNDTVVMSKNKNLFSLCREKGLKTGCAGYHWLSELYNSIPFDKIEDTYTRDEEKAIQYGNFYNIDYYPDEVVFINGEYLRKKYNPDFLMIHSMNIDDEGHKFGSDSKEYRNSIRKVDNILSQFIPKWLEEDYAIIVTSDHGMSEEGMHGGNREDESEVPFWIINDSTTSKLAYKFEQIFVAPIIGKILDIDTSTMSNCEGIYRGY